MKNIQKKFLSYLTMFATLGVVVPPAIRKPVKYHENSLKAKAVKVTSIMWAVVFFCFGSNMILSMLDTFPVNRAVLVKLLTRIALGILIMVFIIDGAVSLVKNSDKELDKS